VRRLRERQVVSLAVPTHDPDLEVADLACLVLLTESDMALLQTVDSAGVAVDVAEGVALIGFEHEGRTVMLRGTAEQLTASLFAFRVADSASIKQLRSSSRMDIEVPVVVSVSDLTEIPGATVDLSRGGAMLELRELPPDGDLVVTLKLPEGREPLTLSARLVRRTDTGVAVHFFDPPPADVRRLESFILSQKTRMLRAAAAV
jgi:hypothetical protein